MSELAIWWILAAVLVGAELMTGTLYLLVYGIAATAAGFAAYMSAGMMSQLIVAAVIGSAGTLILQKWRRPGADSDKGAARDKIQLLPRLPGSLGGGKNGN